MNSGERFFDPSSYEPYIVYVSWFAPQREMSRGFSATAKLLQDKRAYECIYVFQKIGISIPSINQLMTITDGVKPNYSQTKLELCPSCTQIIPSYNQTQNPLNPTDSKTVARSRLWTFSHGAGAVRARQVGERSRSAAAVGHILKPAGE